MQPRLAIRLAVTLTEGTGRAPDQCKQHCLYFLPLPQGHGSLRPILMGTTTGVRYVVPESGHEGYEQQIGPWWLALAGVHC